MTNTSTPPFHIWRCQNIQQYYYKGGMPKGTVGKFGEDLACGYLRSLGFSVKKQNIKVGALELDIVAERDGVLYIFEVRTREKGLAEPLETISYKKRENIWKAADLFVTQSGWNGPCEIGFIGIDISQKPPKIECILDSE